MQNITNLSTESNTTPQPGTPPTLDASAVPPAPPASDQPPTRLLLPPPPQPGALDAATLAPPADRPLTDSPQALVLTSPVPVPARVFTPLPPEKPLTAEEVTHGGLLGRIEVLPDADAADFTACEAVIQRGCDGLVDMGVALGTIRDKKLYRIDYRSFEHYCRERWGFEHSKVYRLMAVAEVCTILQAVPDQPTPQFEAQVRPLVGLDPQTTRLIWQHAVAFSRGRRVTQPMVRQALKYFGYGRPAVTPRAQREARQSRHGQILEGFNHLLKLVGERAPTGVIVDQIQSVSHLVEGLFTKKAKKGVQNLPSKP